MKAHPARFSLLMLLVACLAWVGCGDEGSIDADGNVDNTDFHAEATFRFRLELAGHENLRLEGVSGEVTITESAGSDSIVIAGTRRVRSESAEDAEEHLAFLEVRVEDLSDEVFVKTVQPEHSHGRSYEVEYWISLPEPVDVDVVNVNGEVLLNDVFGDTRVVQVNGWIAGRVTVGAGDTIELAQVNGTIDLGIPKHTSAGFSANVINGLISVSDLIFETWNSDAHSFTGTLGQGDGSISLAVTNGTINVTGLD
jgi:hypothetical protein